MTRGIDRRRFALGSAGLIASARALAGGADDERRAARRQRAARPVRVRRDRLRSGAGERSLFEPRQRAHLRGAARLRPAGGPGAAGAADGRGDAGGLGRLHGLDGAAAARHPLRRRPGVQGPAARARRRRLRVRVQAHLRPGAARARRTPRSPRTASSASRRSGRARCATRSRSTTTASPKACARSTATRCSSSSPSRGRASRRRSPRARMRRWRARSSRPIATTSWRTRSAPARIGSSRGAAARGSSSRRTRPTATCATRASRLRTTSRRQAWAKRFNGRRLPLNDGVEIAVVQENQPRWLSFLNGQADFARVPPELSPIAAPNGKIAPNLAKQGIRLQRYLNPDVALSYFNMEDPVVGGYAPAKVALRRAVQPRVRHRLRDQDHPARPGDPGAGADGAGHLRLRSGAAHRQQQLRRRAREGAARHLRLRRPRRRRLARAARRLAARPHDVERAGADLSPVQRELAAQHGGDRHPHESSRRRSGPST